MACLQPPLSVLVSTQCEACGFVGCRDQSCTDILDLYHKLKSDISSGEEAKVSVSLFMLSAASVYRVESSKKKIHLCSFVG